MHWIKSGSWSSSSKVFFTYRRVYLKHPVAKAIPKWLKNWWYKKHGVSTPFVKVRKRYSTWLGYFKNNDGSFISWNDLDWEKR